ncbi:MULTISPECIES: PRTRC system protein B [Burkholderia cepacia complex]|uniref:PRTRC system protein B n=1 Tax=Burkholderia cepacia complex TaxID=87882 RepID=UPI0006186EB5|nr:MULTISPECIES: PRTRC system protein B [Burkholderia cepacia complex]MBR8093215.1 PRTRC system protein B [Burkholderia cenocepacia]MBY4714344.1 PRTRC system protein B [Burkholderia cepacia]MBY4740018.1 PRTRC system protein B [Burkholderia cepacia]MBY4743471.1 PRTRC system protein B [Burkholderia cepacia]MBY4757398.1 PRTRC system protein B [Burkholderia cepacia]
MINTQVVGSGSSLKLEHAILLYSRSGHPGSASGNGFVTINPVRIEKGNAVIGPGQPASRAALVDALDRLAEREQTRALFHPRLLGRGADYAVWYVPPGKRHLAFNHPSVGGKKAGTCALPGLVFFLVRDDWYVFAYRGKRRPSARTPLYRTPFYNVWQEGRICVGNIDLPKQGTSAPLEQWEDAFFGTWFTHPNIPEAQLLRKGENCGKLWMALLAGKHESFPSALLARMGMRLEDAFGKLVGGEV